MRRLSVLAVGLFAAANLSFGAVIVDKAPNDIPFGTWNPLSGTGTYVYAGSFVASDAALVNVLGIYIANEDTMLDPSQFQLQLWGDLGNAPDPFNVLATTGILTQPSNILALITGNLLAPVNIVAGTRYWIAATTVGLSGTDEYGVGSHIQNSVYNDNGTFWYSNDAAGINFDGQALTPELSIYAEGDVVGGEAPEPATWAMMAMGLGGLAAWRKRTV